VQLAFGVATLKNQWFGDKHDYFKYDLWLEVAQKVKGIGKRTFIPMFTASKAPYPKGKRREPLYAFLQSHCFPKHRSVTRLGDFLHEELEHHTYHAYHDNDEAGFENGSWKDYFRDVQDEWLNDAAILIDPDTRIKLEKCKDPEKYVTFDDIAQIMRGRDINSVVLITQFLVKNAHLREKQLKEKRQLLRERLCDANCGSIGVFSLVERTKNSLGEIAFFIIPVGMQISEKLCPVLREHAKIHGLQLRGQLK